SLVVEGMAVLQASPAAGPASSCAKTVDSSLSRAGITRLTGVGVSSDESTKKMLTVTGSAITGTLVEVVGSGPVGTWLLEMARGPADVDTPQPASDSAPTAKALTQTLGGTL